MTETPASTSAAPKRFNLPLFISIGFISAMLGLYFLNPGFQAVTKEAWAVLTSGDQARISEWVNQFGYWGPVFIVVFMVLQMFLVVINVVALMVVAVLAYGPIWGGVISFVSVIVASSVGYWLGRALGPATVGKLLGHKTEKKVQEQVDRYGIWAVVLARISPVISNDAISIVAGMVKMPFLHFILATVVGIIPLIILISYLGGDIDRLKTGLIVVTILGVLMLVGIYLYDRYKGKEKKG